MCPGQCCYTFVPPSIPLRALCCQHTKGDFPRTGPCRATLGWEFRLQALAPPQQQRQNPFVPSDSSAADSGNLHNQQLKGKGPVGTELGPPGKGSHSLPQSSHSLRQRGPKSVAKSSLRHGRQQQGSSPWNGFRLPSLP